VQKYKNQVIWTSFDGVKVVNSNDGDIDLIQSETPKTTPTTRNTRSRTGNETNNAPESIATRFVTNRLRSLPLQALSGNSGSELASNIIDPEENTYDDETENLDGDIPSVRTTNTISFASQVQRLSHSESMDRMRRQRLPSKRTPPSEAPQRPASQHSNIEESDIEMLDAPPSSPPLPRSSGRKRQPKKKSISPPPVKISKPGKQRLTQLVKTTRKIAKSTRQPKDISPAPISIASSPSLPQTSPAPTRPAPSPTRPAPSPEDTKICISLTVQDNGTQIGRTTIISSLADMEKYTIWSRADKLRADWEIDQESTTLSSSKTSAICHVKGEHPTGRVKSQEHRDLPVDTYAHIDAIKDTALFLIGNLRTVINLEVIINHLSPPKYTATSNDNSSAPTTSNSAPTVTQTPSVSTRDRAPPLLRQTEIRGAIRDEIINKWRCNKTASGCTLTNSYACFADPERQGQHIPIESHHVDKWCRLIDCFGGEAQAYINQPPHVVLADMRREYDAKKTSSRPKQQQQQAGQPGIVFQIQNPSGMPQYPQPPHYYGNQGQTPYNHMPPYPGMFPPQYGTGFGNPGHHYMPQVNFYL
jgi:hypothetical protein